MKKHARRHHIHKAPTFNLEALEPRLLFSGDFRAMDGWGNNLAQPEFGQAGLPLMSIAPVAYADGFNEPRGGDPSVLPSARAISNAVHAQSGDIPSSVFLSQLVFQWGQFISHDVAIENTADPAEPFNIPVPSGDIFFDPAGTGTKTIRLNRTTYSPSNPTVDAPRQQINELTSFIDGSGVYGSDETRAMNLRALTGGRLATSAGNLLPFNTVGEDNGNALGADPTTLFLAGDVRANEQVGLTAMHTLFVREHNYWADRILAEQFPGQDPADPDVDEQVYLLARRIIGAEIQIITYGEFLPAILGPDAISPYSGYKPGVNPTISNIFTTAAYRVGHTMLPGGFQLLANDGSPLAVELPLRNAFFNPAVISGQGIDPILKGLASTVQQEIDRFVVDDVRNFLFGPPGSGGFDLPSLNIQRGRDHGLPSFNDTRIAFGLTPAASFADISTNLDTQVALASAYSSVNEIDLWTGGLAEDPMPGSSLGRTFTAIWIDQFERLRDGDRYFYLNEAFDVDLLAELESTTLATLLHRNTGITSLQPHVFWAKPHVTIQLEPTPGGTSVNIALEGPDLVIMGYNGVPPIRYPLHMVQKLTVIGTDERDLINASAVPAIEGLILELIGGHGDDTLIGSGGNDILSGGKGRNILVGGGGIDAADFSSSSGTVSSRIHKNNRWTRVIRHGEGGGRDKVKGIEQWIGSDHDDRFRAMRGAAGMTLMGGAGNDRITGSKGRSLMLDGGDGRDTLIGTHWDDELYGRGGDDILRGGRGRDLLIGGAGIDTLIGGRRIDTLMDDGTDLMKKLQGSDIVVLV